MFRVIEILVKFLKNFTTYCIFSKKNNSKNISLLFINKIQFFFVRIKLYATSKNYFLIYYYYLFLYLKMDLRVYLLKIFLGQKILNKMLSI
jgi:hypothetical protein